MLQKAWRQWSLTMSLPVCLMWWRPLLLIHLHPRVEFDDPSLSRNEEGNEREREVITLHLASPPTWRGRSWSWCSKYLVTSLQSVGKQKPEPSLSSERCGNVTPLTSQSPYQCNCRAPHFCPVLILLPHQEFALVRCNAIISGIQLQVQRQSCGLWVLSRLFTNYMLGVRITPPARSWYNESLYKSFSAKFYCSQRTYYPTFLSLLHQNEN